MKPDILSKEDREILAAIRLRYRGDHNIMTVFMIIDRLVARQAEEKIERLRAALQLIDDYYQTGGDLMSHVAHIAQDALAGTR